MWLLIWKYEPFWQEIRVESLILMRLLRPVASCIKSNEEPSPFFRGDKSENCNDDKWRVYQLYYDPWARTILSWECNMRFFFTALRHGTDKLGIYIDDQEKICRNCKFHNPPPHGAGVLVLGCWSGGWGNVDDVHIANTLRGCNAAFLCHCWYLFLWCGCWYANMSPSDKTDSQVTIKAHVPLVLFASS